MLIEVVTMQQIEDASFIINIQDICKCLNSVDHQLLVRLMSWIELDSASSRSLILDYAVVHCSQRQ